jgi:hypothetical protein
LAFAKINPSMPRLLARFFLPLPPFQYADRLTDCLCRVLLLLLLLHVQPKPRWLCSGTQATQRARQARM